MAGYNNYMNVTNNLIARASKYINNNSMSVSHGDRAKTAIDKTVKTYRDGIVESLYAPGNVVFAIIRKYHPPEQDSGGNIISDSEGLFNAEDGVDESKLKLPQLFIPIDIKISDVPILKNFIGLPCQVELINGIATCAYLGHQRQQATTISPEEILHVKKYSPNGDITSKEAQDMLANIFGHSLTNIQDFLSMSYDPKNHPNRVLSVANNACLFKDTSQLQDYEVILQPTSIMNGTNNLTMKSVECHMPSSFLSGK